MRARANLLEVYVVFRLSAHALFNAQCSRSFTVGESVPLRHDQCAHVPGLIFALSTHMNWIQATHVKK